MPDNRVVQRQVRYLGEINGANMHPGAKPLMSFRAARNKADRWLCFPLIGKLLNWDVKLSRLSSVSWNFIDPGNGAPVGWHVIYGTFSIAKSERKAVFWIICILECYPVRKSRKREKSRQRLLPSDAYCELQLR